LASSAGIHRPLLLGERRRGQEHVGVLGRLVKKEVLDDQDVELTDRLLRVVEIGLREQRVLAHHVHGPDLAGQAPLDHLGHHATGRARRANAPALFEPRERVRRVALVAGQIRGDAAGVAAALDVVLPAQR
jgi:hypothetical protein